MKMENWAQVSSTLLGQKMQREVPLWLKHESTGTPAAVPAASHTLSDQ
uniref:Alternative protein SOX6 n=1 Tax=Homo sapiens TaxID=9606 RepID=L8EBC2_HUMAN|nr:alternative protein SOX6 [Homo sapiens]